MWDTTYGAQPNPYSADDFRLILRAINHMAADSLLGKETKEKLKTLHVETREALITEANYEKHNYCDECGNGFVILETGVANHLNEDSNIDYEQDSYHVPYKRE